MEALAKLEYTVYSNKQLTLPVNDAVPSRLKLDAGRVTLTLTVSIACTSDATVVLPEKPDMINGTSGRNNVYKRRWCVKVALTLVIHKVIQSLLPFGRTIRLHEIRRELSGILAHTHVKGRRGSDRIISNIQK